MSISTATDADSVVIAVERDIDVVTARQVGREVATALGFRSTEVTLVVTAISEVARNIVKYADEGTITITRHHGDRTGLEVVASDRGPGIADLDAAMQDGFSTGGSLGVGLPGARRLMDDFELASVHGEGTTVTMRRWLRSSAGR